MSKRFNGRVDIQLEPGQAAVVLDRAFWDHMVQWYTIMANECGDPDEKANWVSIISEVEFWVASTYLDPSSVKVLDYDDEWG